MLALFASVLTLFQIRAPLNSKLFFPEDVLKRGIRKSVLKLRSNLLEYQTAYEITFSFDFENVLP